METLKLFIRVIAYRALKISDRMSRALKLLNFERFRTLKPPIGFYNLRALKPSNRVSFRPLNTNETKVW